MVFSMIKITSENQLLETFRSLDRDQVQVPAEFKFPLAVKDYLSWIEPSGHRVYLVFEDTASGLPLGVVFERTPAPPSTPASMCQWCHSVRSGTGVSLLTTAASKNRRVGLHLCTDLNCRERAMGAPGIHDFNESLSGVEKVKQVVRRMNEFAKSNLF